MGGRLEERWREGFGGGGSDRGEDGDGEGKGWRDGSVTLSDFPD